MTRPAPPGTLFCQASKGALPRKMKGALLAFHAAGQTCRFSAMDMAAERVATTIPRAGHQKNITNIMQTRDKRDARIGPSFDSHLDALFVKMKSA